MNYLRTIVSGKKKRFINENFNLDLSYITPRIIAMAFPGTGITSLYRNKLIDVADFLNQRHSNNYLILNLSGYVYDIGKFHKVIHKTEWLDHHSPPLDLLFDLIKIIHDYLLENDKHIIVINCNAGKGRTGTLICCYLLFSGRFNNINDAFDYYTLKRFNKGFGVTHASQKRYVNYFYQLITKEKKILFPYVRLLKWIKISCIPYDKITQYIPCYNISEKNKSLLNVSTKTAYISERKEMNFNKESLDLIVKGDILIELFHQNTFKKKKLGRVAFNTAFIDKDKEKIKFHKKEIDPYKFSIKPYVRDEYCITIIIKKLDECQCNNVIGEENICDKCKNILKNENILEKYSFINEIVELYEYNIEKGRKILFGNEKDDIEEIFINKRNLLKINPNTDRRDKNEIDKEEKCYIF